MGTFDRHDLQRMAVSATGALALSAACIFGAVAPARAEAPASLARWQAQVEHRIAAAPADDSEQRAPAVLHTAEVALHFSAGGDFAGASLARSSGSRALDARAVALAGGLTYPRLPQGVRGATRDVTMRLYFGDGTAGAAIPAAAGAARMADVAHRKGTEIAVR